MSKMTVGMLREQLEKLPDDTRVFTAGSEGIFNCENGNLSPFKVYESKFGICLFVDDGAGDHGNVSEDWVSLDEYERDNSKAH